MPNDLYENLKKAAAVNHRSLNNEIIVCIEKAIKNRRIDKTQFPDPL
ncbi:MAG: Arc family DNA-binding protein [candidate division KSB1 bacterium]|nr:Arc family DNA-binding protein [candidate division KSB1 bacterium]